MEEMNEILSNALEDDSYVIICDTNVFLDIYRYAPAFTVFAMDCLNKVENKIILAATTELEFKLHHEQQFRTMEKRMNNIFNNVNTSIIRSCQKMLDSFNQLAALQYEESNELKEYVQNHTDKIKEEVNMFFLQKNISTELVNIWKEDEVNIFIDKVIGNNQRMQLLSQKELYTLSANGEKRYKDEVPPGYKDNKKDGIKKYSDYIFWWEVIRYAKDNEKNVIFVTNDIKQDWWQGANFFHTKLIEEFERKTSRKIIPLTSLVLYSSISKKFNIEKSEYIDVVLEQTNDEYITSNEKNVFDLAVDSVEYNLESYIDTRTTNIGSEGISELEIIEHSFKYAEQIDRYDDITMYNFYYTIKVEGISHEYHGRDEDSKEVILSSGMKHIFEGELVIEISRDTGTFLYSNSDSDTFEIVDTNCTLKEIKSEMIYDSYKYEYENTCPRCNDIIDFENDGLNGFCNQCIPY